MAYISKRRRHRKYRLLPRHVHVNRCVQWQNVQCMQNGRRRRWRQSSADSSPNGRTPWLLCDLPKVRPPVRDAVRPSSNVQPSSSWPVTVSVLWAVGTTINVSRSQQKLVSCWCYIWLNHWLVHVTYEQRCARVWWFVKVVADAAFGYVTHAPRTFTVAAWLLNVLTGDDVIYCEQQFGWPILQHVT